MPQTEGPGETPEESRAETCRKRVDGVLRAWLPDEELPVSRLQRAMRYALLGSGKRVRPLLVYTAGESLGVPVACLDGPAAAVECIHSYSLIHDDLPSMDDDDLRRGRPTCHIAFDEATAILAGDALQVLAFTVLADDPHMRVTPSTRLSMISRLARASGTDGMAGGQAMDLDAAGNVVDAGFVERMHRMKTGALIEASVMLGALAFESLADSDRDCLARYGAAIGLAFQIWDDILDEEGDVEVLGKRTGQDQARDKPTYPSVTGIAAAHERVDRLHREAMDALNGFSGDKTGLVWLSEYLLNRSF